MNPNGFRIKKVSVFYLDYNLTANISAIWTVRDGKPVEESELYQSGEVIYRGENERNEFEIWVDAYDSECDIDDDFELWIGHTWKPYFYHYNSDNDRIEAYGGELISKEEFEELSGTNLIEENEAEWYFCKAIAFRKQNGYTKDKGGDCYGTNIKCICTSGT